MAKYYLPEDVEEVERMLLGHTVVKVDESTLTLDDGRTLRIGGNEGCGGCEAGNYDITTLNDCPVNAIMDVVLVDQASSFDEHTYQLFVLAQDERIELVTAQGDDGNGYYGTGFWIEVSS